MTPLAVGGHTFSYIYKKSALDAMLQLGKLGYKTFEILISAPHCWPAEIDRKERTRVASRLADLDLTVTSLCFPSIDNNLTCTAKIMREQSIDAIRETIDLAADWSAPYVVVIPGKLSPLFPAPLDWTMDYFLDGMLKLSAHARGSGVELLLENVPTTFIPRIKDMVRALKLLGDKRVAINYDVANAVFIGADPVADVKLMKGGLLRNVHLSDTTRKAFKHDPVGQGIVPFAKMAKALRDIDYRGVSILEMVVKKDIEKAFIESNKKLAKMGWAALGA